MCIVLLMIVQNVANLRIGNNVKERGVIETVLVQGSHDPVLSLVLSLTSCVTLHRSFRLSVSQLLLISEEDTRFLSLVIVTIK